MHRLLLTLHGRETNTRKLLEDIPNKVRNAMSIVVDVNRLEEDGKEYIEIVVPPYPVAISCFSEQAANYSVVGNCILVNVQICNKEKKISDFPLYASLHLIHGDFSYHSIARWLSLKSHAILYDKDIVKRKCHRNVRAFHPTVTHPNTA